jgi:hypothetical protein
MLVETSRGMTYSFHVQVRNCSLKARLAQGNPEGKWKSKELSPGKILPSRASETKSSL